jgi:hypothetical protein
VLEFQVAGGAWGVAGVWPDDRMSTLTRHHVTAFVDPAVSEPVEELRRRWDPQMAGQIAAHVTVVYPEEIPDSASLEERAAAAAAVPSGSMISFPPHITIVHPRTSGLGEQAWAGLAACSLGIRFTVICVAITAFDGDRWLAPRVLHLAATPGSHHSPGRNQ